MAKLCIWKSLTAHQESKALALFQYTELVQTLHNRVIGRMIKMYRDRPMVEPKVLQDYGPMTVNAISDRMREIEKKL